MTSVRLPLFLRFSQLHIGVSGRKVGDGGTEEPVDLLADTGRGDTQLISKPAVECEGPPVPVSARLAFVRFITVGQPDRSVCPEQEAVDRLPRIEGRNG